jgi:hypothetical protein
VLSNRRSEEARLVRRGCGSAAALVVLGAAPLPQRLGIRLALWASPLGHLQQPFSLTPEQRRARDGTDQANDRLENSPRCLELPARCAVQGNRPRVVRGSSRICVFKNSRIQTLMESQHPAGERLFVWWQQTLLDGDPVWADGVPAAPSESWGFSSARDTYTREATCRFGGITP